ncbi:MAG: hypothetical protein AB8B55_24515, partial [Mariniblastus sp.]
MNSQVRLEHVEKALAARDPQLVELMIQVAKAQPATNLPPLPETVYTFQKFRNEIGNEKFYSLPRDVQHAGRLEKIAKLDSQDDDALEYPHLDRYRSHELILKLWNSDGSFERDCLIKIIREIPLVYGPWKALKQIFKQAEAAKDTEILAALSHRFDLGHADPTTEVSKRTLGYLRRRSWRYLRNVANELPGCYAETAADFLSEYSGTDRWLINSSWVWNHIFYHNHKRFSRTKIRGYYHSHDILKDRAFTDLWKR